MSFASAHFSSIQNGIAVSLFIYSPSSISIVTRTNFPMLSAKLFRSARVIVIWTPRSPRLLAQSRHAVSAPSLLLLTDLTLYLPLVTVFIVALSSSLLFLAKFFQIEPFIPHKMADGDCVPTGTPVANSYRCPLEV